MPIIIALVISGVHQRKGWDWGRAVKGRFSRERESTKKDEEQNVLTVFFFFFLSSLFNLSLSFFQYVGRIYDHTYLHMLCADECKLLEFCFMPTVKVKKKEEKFVFFLSYENWYWHKIIGFAIEQLHWVASAF